MSSLLLIRVMSLECQYLLMQSFWLAFSQKRFLATLIFQGFQSTYWKMHFKQIFYLCSVQFRIKFQTFRDKWWVRYPELYFITIFWLKFIWIWDLIYKIWQHKYNISPCRKNGQKLPLNATFKWNWNMANFGMVKLKMLSFYIFGLGFWFFAINSGSLKGKNVEISLWWVVRSRLG